MGMITLATYRTSVSDCGLADLSDTILTKLVNRAQVSIVGSRFWTFRNDSEAISGTETIANLGPVRRVVDSDDYPLAQTDKTTLLRQGYDLTATGTPELWYYDDTSRSITTYQRGAATVHYYATPELMTADGSTCLVPDIYDDAVVFKAAALGFARVGIPEQARLYNDFALEVVESMRVDYLEPYVSQALPIPYDVTAA